MKDEHRQHGDGAQAVDIGPVGEVIPPFVPALRPCPVCCRLSTLRARCSATALSARRIDGCSPSKAGRYRRYDSRRPWPGRQDVTRLLSMGGASIAACLVTVSVLRRGPSGRRCS